MEGSPAGRIGRASRRRAPRDRCPRLFFAATECRGALAVGPSLGGVKDWNPPADARFKRIGLDQISRWYAQSACARDVAPRLIRVRPVISVSSGDDQRGSFSLSFLSAGFGAASATKRIASTIIESDRFRNIHAYPFSFATPTKWR